MTDVSDGSSRFQISSFFNNTEKNQLYQNFSKISKASIVGGPVVTMSSTGVEEVLLYGNNQNRRQTNDNYKFMLNDTSKESLNNFSTIEISSAKSKVVLLSSSISGNVLQA